MLCIASFIVLLILSIFSAKYRPYVKESFDCVFRRVTFRPCNTGFDVKVKSKIVVELSKKSERLAVWFNRYFELISWVFVVSFFLSLGWTIRGGYLFWTTGSCNGLNQGGFCVMDPTGANNAVSGTGTDCRAGGDQTGSLTLEGVKIDKKPIVFIGCYACKYSKQTYPLVKQLAEKKHVPIEYVFYPTHKEAEYLSIYDYAVKEIAPEKYAMFVDQMYQATMEAVASESATLHLIESLDIDTLKVSEFINLQENKDLVQKQIYEIDKTGIYGTPTVFVNGNPVVGPKPYRVYRRLLTKSWL